MPNRPCPACNEIAPRLLESPSKIAHTVNYYRCEKCAHVWTVPKDDPDGPIRHVTIKPETKPGERK